MKNLLLVFVIALSFYKAYNSYDPYLCAPNIEMPIISRQLNHNLYKIPTPFPVSYGGYVPDFPDCSLEGVADAVDWGYKGIQVTAGYLRSREVALIAEPTLYDYAGGEEYRYVYTLTGDEFANKVFKKEIEYPGYTYRYTGVYRATFFYEIFDAIPNFNDGVFFVSTVPELATSLLPEDKVVGKLLMKWIKYTIDTFQAWNRVIIYDPDVTRSLDMVSEFGCNHLFGFESYSVLYDTPFFERDLRLSHKGVSGLRDCTNNFPTNQFYPDFLLESGSVERMSCVSMTIAEMDTFTYKLTRSSNPGRLTDFIYQNYYTDTSTYYVGLFATTYDMAYYRGDASRLHNDMMGFVNDYSLQFFITPVDYYLLR